MCVCVFRFVRVTPPYVWGRVFLGFLSHKKLGSVFFVMGSVQADPLPENTRFLGSRDVMKMIEFGAVPSSVPTGPDTQRPTDGRDTIPTVRPSPSCQSPRPSSACVRAFRYVPTSVRPYRRRSSFVLRSVRRARRDGPRRSVQPGPAGPSGPSIADRRTPSAAVRSQVPSVSRLVGGRRGGAYVGTDVRMYVRKCIRLQCGRLAGPVQVPSVRPVGDRRNASVGRRAGARAHTTNGRIRACRARADRQHTTFGRSGPSRSSSLGCLVSLRHATSVVRSESIGFIQY